MTSYQKGLINEHSYIYNKIKELHANVYNAITLEKDDKVEYANKCIQLSAMKKYEEALSARMKNAGVVFDGNEYYTKVTDCDIAPSIGVICTFGSDYDADASKINNSKINE
ncbi:MAG: hypothetical protein [crAssphage sp. isolate ctcc615]|uniref:Uncharacterized protein n=1 Tax=crAssphage sp. isolate ctcc615 TaxID=2989853 RepID=A0A345BP19_9CAUD|nr:MAG: hypothetical protein KNU00_gp06 [crAssphage sp. isolate ctcc615]AXF52190.1 MAG: hypothetical protein [crAssphage sp. isolate ctcc615]